MKVHLVSVWVTLAVGSAGCRSKEPAPPAKSSTPPQQPPSIVSTRTSTSAPRTETPARPPETTTSATLILPIGFTATLFAVVEGTARHLAVRDNGDVYVRLWESQDGKATVGLRDENGDGKADLVERFGEKDQVGTGIAIRNGYLYFSSDTAIYRTKLNPRSLVPTDDTETVVSGFPNQSGHTAKPITFDEQGALYVNIGAPSNACQIKPRSPGSPGRLPCDQLEHHGGIWRFPPDRTGLDVSQGTRFASGTRQIVALEFNPMTKKLYAVQHGRDQLHQLFEQFYTERDSAELPSEELLLLNEGFVGGWPYTYYDHRRNARMLAPEYGGDGKKEAEPGKYPDPLYAFPGHYAPNDLVFYEGKTFPERYHGGAFIAFHGSWNRAPLPQKGYQVAFVPFKGDRPSGPAEIFADGFAQRVPLDQPGNAAHRPTGVAVAPDGALFISDSKAGHIWRVAYHPDKAHVR